MGSPHMYNAGTLELSMTDSPPIAYMECGNLVTVNDLYGPPIPYVKCRNLVTGSPTMYNMISMQEPCNCQ